MLIAMANSASCSSRADLILDPYPSVVDPDDADVLALCPQVQMYGTCVHAYYYNGYFVQFVDRKKTLI